MARRNNRGRHPDGFHARACENDRARDFEINVLSSRANTVSTGDAVVEVKLPRYARTGDIVVELNKEDVTSSLLRTTRAAGSRVWSRGCARAKTA